MASSWRKFRWGKAGGTWSQFCLCDLRSFWRDQIGFGETWWISVPPLRIALLRPQSRHTDGRTRVLVVFVVVATKKQQFMFSVATTSSNDSFDLIHSSSSVLLW